MSIAESIFLDGFAHAARWAEEVKNYPRETLIDEVREQSAKQSAPGVIPYWQNGLVAGMLSAFNKDAWTRVPGYEGERRTCNVCRT